MLNKLRGFSKSRFAGLLVAIIIVPFVFWGMGSVFSGGNTNNVAKINNDTISTKDFINHINQAMINPDLIKNNLDNNILERILSELVSEKLLDMEIEDYKVFVSEKTLASKIKSNPTFSDEKNNFSRLKYEKFLLENNLSAVSFENRLKKQELKKNLFQYIGGGIRSPYFLNNKIYTNETKKVELEYFDLNYAYETEIGSTEIDDFIKKNIENLKEDFIDFSYVKILPKNLIEIDEFNKEFFKKIDEIENSILNGSSINEISNNYNLKVVSKNNYNSDNEENEIIREIYNKRNEEKIQLVDKNDYFILYEIQNINKVLPNKSNINFIEKVKKNIILEKKLDLHQNLFQKIQDKQMNDIEFLKVAKSRENIKNISINGINDVQKFDNDSIKLIYSLPKSSFTLITDEENKIYFAKVKNIYSNKLSNNNPEIKKYLTKSNEIIITDIYGSYDLSLNNKYKVKYFQSTLDRVKNYFR